MPSKFVLILCDDSVDTVVMHAKTKKEVKEQRRWYCKTYKAKKSWLQIAKIVKE